MSKWGKVLSWAVGATLVASVAWAATYWKVDSYGNIKAARSSVLLSAGQTSNCKLNYTGSTLSVLGADGNALSASNPCIVGMPNGADPLVFTSPVSTTFGAASDTDGNTLGTSAGTAWGNELPLILRACAGNTKNYFGFTRYGARRVTCAAAAGCAQEGDTDGDDEGDFFIMDSGLTLADETEKPCVDVGVFRATKNAADEWSVVAIDSTIDGFGRFAVGRNFYCVAGQNGADPGEYLRVSGGTVATWATPANIVCKYQIDVREGLWKFYFDTTAAGNCTAGSHANICNMVMPLKAGFVTNGAIISGGGYLRYGGTERANQLVMSSSANHHAIAYVGGSTLCNGYSNAGDDIIFHNVFSFPQN